MCLEIFGVDPIFGMTVSHNCSGITRAGIIAGTLSAVGAVLYALTFVVFAIPMVVRETLGVWISPIASPTVISILCGAAEIAASPIPNYADRYRHGEPIATGFVESAVNQVVSKRIVKKQQMRWTMTGAHRLLQVRTRVHNQQLRHDFERWHPELRTTADPVLLAA